MQELGVTPENNKITFIHPDADFPMKKKIDSQVFSEDKDGNIVITIYDINGQLITYKKKAGKDKQSTASTKILDYYVTRLKSPMVDKNGKITKYLFPKGAGTFPFFPLPLLDKFNNAEKIKTLVMTEGYFKAFKGALHGIDIVGLGSITHFRNAETKQIHGDILSVIKRCQVDNIIWLQDGDCRDLKGSAIEEGTDLYKRPADFFSSARNIKELLSDLDVQVFFANVISDSVTGDPKGLDDIIIQKMKIDGNEAAGLAKGTAAKKKAKEEGERQAGLDITTDLMSLSKLENAGRHFYKVNITYNLAKLQRYFHINTAEAFYNFHTERIKDIDFTFNGTKYHFDHDNNELKVIIPGAAKLFFRVGDQYHKWVHIPDKHGHLVRTFHRRMKSTILDDHGKHFIEHVPKYEAFCNTPDHINFQQTPNHCYNLYAPFDHEADAGDCSITIDYLRHIFGDGKIKWRDPKTKKKHEISELDLGLDYVQLLYQKPTQKLPILCLVSKVRNTGKTTLANFFKVIFGNNMAIVGNADLANDFNASWAPKLIVCCDETKVDKQVVVERIKSLSTADKILMNAKGKDHVEIEFFGKFILLTNNEENFIYVDQEETRYWIRSIPAISEEDKNVNLLEEMIQEIPAFLDYLQHRKMATERLDRMWFDPALIKTEALAKVVRFSQPVVEKEMRTFICDMFKDFGCDEILMSSNDIRRELFGNKYENTYVQKILRDRLGVDNFANEEGNHVTKRYDYPRFETEKTNGIQETNRVDVKCTGRPFVFKVEAFLTEEERKKIVIDNDLGYIPKLLSAATNGSSAAVPATVEEKPDDLPF